MTYDINATLERLEQNLKQLDSARKQVETTVQASEGLQNAVAGYVASINSLVKEIKAERKRFICKCSPLLNLLGRISRV